MISFEVDSSELTDFSKIIYIYGRTGKDSEGNYYYGISKSLAVRIVCDNAPFTNRLPLV